MEPLPHAVKSAESFLAGNPNPQYARSQLGYVANQASLAVRQIHYKGMLLPSSFEDVQGTTRLSTHQILRLE